MQIAVPKSWSNWYACMSDMSVSSLSAYRCCLFHSISDEGGDEDGEGNYSDVQSPASYAGTYEVTSHFCC